MAKKFRPLCTIAFRHNYFNRNGGVCRDFDLIPMPSALKLFKQFDLRLQEDSAGYKLWFGQDTPRRPLIFTAGAPLRLSFLMRLRTPYFLNYTRLPFVDLSSYLYYFNNLDLLEGDPVQLLNRGPFVGLNDGEMVGKESIKFTDPLQSANRSAFAGLHPDNPTPKPALEFEDPAPPNSRDIFGILDIFIGENGVNIAGFDEGTLVPARYELLFQARETFWRYFVFNPKALEITGLSIQTGNGNHFENLGEEHLQGGQKAVRLESAGSIQLEEFSRHTFTLKVSGLPQNTEINLPTPDIRMIKPEVNPVSNDRKVYSDMYVYL